MNKQDFFEKYLHFAKESEEKTGINAYFTLAQAAYESAWGEKAPGNNFFGIKAPKNTEPERKQLITTHEVLSSPDINFPEVISIKKRSDGKYSYTIKDWFMKYDTAKEGFDHHSGFFFANKRYGICLSVRHDAKKFAECIVAAGYATDPNYVKTIHSIIDSLINLNK